MSESERSRKTSRGSPQRRWPQGGQVFGCTRSLPRKCGYNFIVSSCIQFTSGTSGHLTSFFTFIPCGRVTGDKSLKKTLLTNEELLSFYRSPNIVRMIKYRRLRWAGHVTRMEEGMSTFKNFQVNLQERDL